MVIVGINGGSKFVFMLLDLNTDALRSAAWSFHFFTLPRFKDPRSSRTFSTEELIALATIESNILEIKLLFALFAFLSLSCFLNKLLG